MKFRVIRPDISLGVNGGQRIELENINSKIWVHIIAVLLLLLTCYIMSDSLWIMTFKNQGQIFHSNVQIVFWNINLALMTNFVAFRFLKWRAARPTEDHSCWWLTWSLPRPGPRPEPRVRNSSSSPLFFLGL